MYSSFQKILSYLDHANQRLAWLALPESRAGWLPFRPCGRNMAYFVHSHAPEMKDPAHVPVVIRWNNVLGYQFHPEKSGPARLDPLCRFLQL